MAEKLRWWFTDVVTRRYAPVDWKDENGRWHNRADVKEVREGGCVLLFAGMPEAVVGLASEDLEAGLRNLLARAAKSGKIAAGEQEELFAKLANQLPRTVSETDLVCFPDERVPERLGYLADCLRGVAVVASGEVLEGCQYPTRAVIVMRRQDAEAGAWRGRLVPGPVEVYWPKDS